MRRDINGGPPASYRDASNSSGPLWKQPPTIIRDPATSLEVIQRLRGNENPFRMNNNLKPSIRTGNPNVSQTLLAKAAEGRNFPDYGDTRPRKRPKHDFNSSSSTAVKYVPFSQAGNSASRGTATKSDIRSISPPPSNGRRNPPPDNVEVIDVDLNATSEDLGERVPRGEKPKSPSPDPINFLQRHDFETHPAERRPPLNKGKGRAEVTSELIVEGSEEDESIEDFNTPPSKYRRQSDSKTIPHNIVKRNTLIFEEKVQVPVPAIDLTRKTGVVRKMKGKDDIALGRRRSTGTSDPIGTSSSELFNSLHENHKILTLPLEAYCLGLHLFQHSESSSLKLVYDVNLKQIRVVHGGSSPEKIEFKLERNIKSMMIVNDKENKLKENLVVQFTAAQRDEWKDIESRYKGFSRSDGRGKDALTFLFSTAKDRDFNITTYQMFLNYVRKACSNSAAEIIPPSRGKIIWQYVTRYAEMFEQTESRPGKGDPSENDVAKPPALSRSITPFPSTTRTRTSFLESDPPNGTPGPSVSHRRSTRQSAMQEKVLLPPLDHPDPDEVVLMYPPTGTGALSIMHSDLRRLQPEEYLNDTLIEFGLKLWLDDLRATNPALAEQIHVFSSFFYKKLNNRKNPEDGYKSVRKWTSKVDLFTKKYVIVPINENIHWYLAIIYEPGYTLQPPLPHPQLSNTRITRQRKQEGPSVGTTVNSEPVESNTTVRTTEEVPETDTSSVKACSATANEELDNVATKTFDKSCSIAEQLSTTSSEIQTRDSSPLLLYPDDMDVDTYIFPNPACEIAETLEPNLSSVIPVNHFYGSEHKSGDIIMENEDSGEDQQHEAEVDDMLAVTQRSSGDLPLKTYIFTLDSLGSRHPQAIKVLKQYLSSEAKDKRSFDEVRDAVGKQVQVPVQPNTWDCGIYLLHFVKVFMNAPSEFMERILFTKGTMPSSERKEMWQNQEIPLYRDHLKYRVMQLSKEWRAEKTAREEASNKWRSEDALEVQALSSEGEVDIVEDIPSVKPAPAPRQKQLAMRLRG